MQGVGQHAETLSDGRHFHAFIEQGLGLGEEFIGEPVTLARRGRTKKAAAPSTRSFLQARFTVTSGTPNALEIWLCDALPLAMSWLVKKRNEAMSSAGCVKTGRWPLK